MKAERIRIKDEAFCEAWERHEQRAPTLNERVLGISVALHETNAGDAWPGADGILDTADDERNKGATNLRSLNEIECVIIASKARELLANDSTLDRDLPHELDRLVYVKSLPQHFEWRLHRGTGENAPEYVSTLSAAELRSVEPMMPIVTKGHAARAKLIQDLLVEALPDCPAGDPEDGRRGAIHCDSAPGKGAYYVWFSAFNDPELPAFENEVASWDYYLRILTRTMAERAALASGSAEALAAAMYSASYYTGFHKRGVLYRQADGSELDGAVLNIRDYAKGILRHVPSVRAALAAAK
jgi:hypothetical protein